MEQHLLSPGLLLDEDGNLKEAGYAFDLVKEYHRKDIKASGFRIKEWDYYYIGDHKRAIALTIDDNSYMDLFCVTLFDYEKKTYVEKSYMHAFSMGKRNLPESSKEGDTVYQDKNVDVHFVHEGDIRHLFGTVKDVEKGFDLKFDLKLAQTTDKSMVIATPFLKKKHFYYNQKINNLKADGFFEYRGERVVFSSAYGVLDWGRGVWTRKNTWYWASLNDYQDGHTIGFNLGYGFGDTSKASENMFFFDEEAYKLDDVKFEIPQDEKGEYLYEKDWKFTSSDGSIDLTFHPLIVRKGGANAVIIKSIQRQVFGLYSGTIKAGEKVFELHDLLGFAERVYNCW